METTYTYIARNVENPGQVVTFTLQNHHLSVGLGAPLEQIESMLERMDIDDTEEDTGQSSREILWLKPLAISLFERGVGPFRLEDVSAESKEEWLRVSAWYRAGGLALVPVTLVDGRVDNPEAAQAFVKELDTRKSDATGVISVFKLLDYWLTWILAGIFMLGLFQVWRRKAKT